MRKKVVFFVLVGITIIYLTITIQESLDHSSDETVQSLSLIESVNFASWDSEVKFKGEHPREYLNLIFVSPASFVEAIQAVTFSSNNRAFDIENYTIDKGDSINDELNVYTLLITIQPNDSSNHVAETLNQIVIITDDNLKHHFPIGNIHVDQGTRSNFLRAHKEHTVSYNDFTYETSLENPSNYKITLKDFYINNKNIQLNNLKINDQSFNDEVIIPPGEIVEVSSELSLKEESKYDFYQITPTAEIEVQEEIKQVHLDSSFYELFNIDQDKIDSIMSRSN